MNKNYFELFDLDEQYAIDLPMLEERFQQLRRSLHPDRFAGKSSAEQRMATQYAALIQDAYQSLKSPVKRAVYLLKQLGIVVDLEKNTLMDNAFLFEQLELREKLESEASAGEAREYIQQSIVKLEQQLKSAFAEKDLKTAEELVKRLQFFMKL